jgi:hypothetical protein
MLGLRNRLAPLRVYFSTPRARNDYSTHVPILIGLARIREIKSVLEFGCGYYSTLTFLNAAAFPHLERLQSVENDASWAETLHGVAKHDDRWNLNLVAGEIADSVPSMDLEAFDLILIDDSKTSAQRASTIRAITNKAPQRPWIAIHDYEVREYRVASRGFKQRYALTAYNPETGLVCNKVTDFKTLDRKLKQNCKILEPDDVEGWLTVSRKS